LYVQHSVEILREIRRVLKPNGVCFYNIADSYNAHPGQRTVHDKGGIKQQTVRGSCEAASRNDQKLKAKDACLIPFRIALAAQADGWWLRSDVIWSKPDAMPESVMDRPTCSHEYIFILTKQARYYWNREAVMELCASGPSNVRKMKESKERITIHQNDDALAKANSNTNIGKKRGVGGTRIHGNLPGRDDGGAACNKPDQLYRNMRSVWEFARTSKGAGGHFAVFPEELVIRCLLAATKPGDLVLDPFAGSGTVGFVAYNMGRRFVLCDLAYQDLQRERIPPMAAFGFVPLEEPAEEEAEAVQPTLLFL
jgi:DNA modification methylase